MSTATAETDRATTMVPGRGLIIGTVIAAMLTGVLGLAAVGRIGTREVGVAVIVVLGCIPAVRVFLVPRTDILAPSVLIPLAYAMYAIGPLLGPGSFAPRTYVTYTGLQLLGFVGLYGGFAIGTFWRSGGQQRWSRGIVVGISSGALVVTTAAILLALAIPSLLSQIRAFGGLGGLVSTGYGGARYLILSRSLTLGSGLEWSLLAAILLLVMAVSDRSRRWLAVPGMGVGVVIGWLVLVLGGRNTIAYSVLFGAVLVQWRIGSLPPRRTFLLLLAGFAAGQAYSLTRFFLPTHGLLGAIGETWKIVLGNLDLVSPLAGNEFRAPSSSLLEVLEAQGVPHWRGASYLVAVFMAVPGVSRLAATFGANPSTWRLVTLHPDMAASGGGLGFSPIAEAWLNFGALGVLVVMVVYGLTIQWIYRNACHRRTWSAVLLYAGSLPVFMFDGLRIHAASFVYKWTRAYLMPWIIYLLSAHLLALFGRPVRGPDRREGIPSGSAST